MVSTSKLDAVYRSILLTKFFTKGWGNADNLKRLFVFRKKISVRENCQKLVPHDYPLHIDKVESFPRYKVLEGHFLSPFVHYVPEVVPKEVETARFQMLLPTKWPSDNLHPVCLHLAGTGDHFYWRRRMLMAKPLLKEGIASILLENPFYGLRKPVDQTRSSLHNVSDIFVMGGCLILESLALFHWCESQGFGPLAITGISMGGHMASLAGCSWHKPIAIVPCLSWTTASSVFTQGVMSGAIPWNLLETQYTTDHVFKEKIYSLVESPEESDAFLAGCHFARNYPESMERVKKLQCEQSTKLCSSYEARSSLEEVSNYPSTCCKIKATKSTSNVSTMSSHTAIQKMPKQNFSPQLDSYLKQETLSFMRGIMDECTHLGNFSVPIDPSLSIIVAAQKDAYVLRDGITALPDLWPGCEVRYLNCGHIAAFLFNQGVFRKAVVDALNRTAEKYFQNYLPPERIQETTA